MKCKGVECSHFSKWSDKQEYCTRYLASPNIVEGEQLWNEDCPRYEEI